MRIKKTTTTELIVKGILLFSILTVLQGMQYLDSINKTWLVAVSLILLLRLTAYKYTTKQICILTVTLVLHAIALYYTDFPLVHVNMLFYFLLWVVLYVVFSKSRNDILEVFRSNTGYIKGILWGWTILVGVSVFLPSSYNGSYFYSFAGSSFRFMPTVLIISALAMYMAVQKKEKKYNLFLILPVYSALMNQSRTYFGVFFLFLLMYLYMCFRSKKTFYLMLIPILAGIMVLASVSGIMDKFLATQYDEQSLYDFWATITSGRSDFWGVMLEAFFDLPLGQQFVGNGFNFVYDVTDAYYTNALWAHNDIINILLNFGYIGVYIYIWAYATLVKAFWNKGSRVPKMVRFLFHTAVFINSMMNMSYTYMCAMISYPLFLCVISEKYDEVCKT